MKYYTDEEVKLLKREMMKYRLIFYILMVSFIVSNTLLICISSYETKEIYKWILAPINVFLLLLITVVLISLIAPLSKLYKHYTERRIIENNEELHGNLINISEKYISLNEIVTYKEITIQEGSKLRKLRLLKGHEIPEKYIGKHIKVTINNLFIVEVNNND